MTVSFTDTHTSQAGVAVAGFGADIDDMEPEDVKSAFKREHLEMKAPSHEIQNPAGLVAEGKMK